MNQKTEADLRQAAIEAGGRALRSVMFPEIDPADPIAARWLEFAEAVLDAGAPVLLRDLRGRHYLIPQFLRGTEACACGKDRFCPDLRLINAIFPADIAP